MSIQEMHQSRTTDSPTRTGLRGSSRFRMMAAALLLGAVGLAGSGCSDAQGGALLGAGLGALAGNAIGGNTEATLIGTAIGTAVGYGVGNEQDKNRIERRRSGNYQY
jgi:hypothetical protein